MNSTLSPETVGSMTTGEVYDRIASATMKELAGMTKEAVLALPVESRLLRRDRLAEDTTLWRHRHIAEAAQVKPSTVAGWRWAYLLNGIPEGTAISLIRPANEGEGGVKMPFEKGPRGRDEPEYEAGKVRQWLAEWKRNSEDFFPKRRFGAGRPPETDKG